MTSMRMHPMVFLLSVVVWIGCDAPPNPAPVAPVAPVVPVAPVASTAPVVAPRVETAPAVAAPAVVSAPRAYVLLRKVKGSDQIEVFVPVEGGAPRSLKLRAWPEGGSVHRGGTSPILSADGKWLAYLRDGVLGVQPMLGGKSVTVAKHPARKVNMLLSGWSPDSKSLLYYLGEVDDMDGTPLPKGVQGGFYLAQGTDWNSTHVAGLEGFDAWTGDSQHVVYEREAFKPETLMKAAIADGKGEALQSTDSNWGFSQLVVRGDEMVAGLDSKLVLSKLDGTDAVDVTDRANFAYYQWPRFSPDGARIAYVADTNVEVWERSSKARTKLATCANRNCRFAWLSEVEGLLLDQGTLRRVGLDGVVRDVATDVAGFAVAGEY